MRKFLLLLAIAMICAGGRGSPGAHAASNTVDDMNFTPAVPFILDGVRYAPADIHRFDQQPLHFVLDRSAQANGALRAFRTRAAATAYMAQQARAVQRVRADTLAACSGPHAAQAFNWPNFNRGMLDITGNLPNLTKVQRGFWPWDNWNDVISSAQVGCQTSITLFVDVNYSGGSLAIPQNTSLAGLDSGIDNQTSSIQYRAWDPVCQVRQAQNGQAETWCEVYDDYGTFLYWVRVA